MTILRRLVSNVHSLILRTYPEPLTCYNICNNGYLEAQRVGKVPALCASGSNFLTYYDSCQQCINEVGISWTEYLPPLTEYVDYCNSTNPNQLNQTATDLSYSVIPTTISSPVTTGDILTTWLFTTSVTIYPPVPSTTVVQIAQTVNGKPTTYTFTTTYANLPIGGAEVTNGTSTPPPTPSPDLAAPISHSSHPTRAWIAGPVAGGVVAVSIVMLGSLFLWRRNRKRRQPSAELEARGIMEEKSELEAPNYPQELNAVNTRALHADAPHELEANR
ncbi:uncharacterized protein GGS22DRAFT_158582 [Annulohypoxylon maeteangense]|uniref:uncharacterized protein n=1 Tax=Annulohypoxylon maeteangense TaxID=1927788 RepID=UPI002008DE27|nr:uncharacterized protein GGS22DRAFT_158582 [Annulohypoxylon maeteangense]KAI0886740.1 hypothetical protein GGS22DRAFT_158582 [Annulohypoxylon maeteangense]